MRRRKINVLILEDNPSDAELVVHELKRSGFELQWRRVDTEPEFLSQLSPALDIILSDFSLPTLDAYRALKLLKGRDLDIPLIVVSGTIGEETAVKTIREGAADYILKDRLSRLGLAIDNALSNQALRRERKAFESQIREAQKMESLGTLAGGVAHDFNNILGIILGYTELLRDVDATREKKQEYFEYILKAIARGSTLVRQVLTFARKDEVAQSSIQINDVVREVSKMLQETLPKLIAISTNLDESLPPAMMDGNQFHQALLNLCVNARDAIFDNERGDQSDGTISITTGTMRGDELRKQHPAAVGDAYVHISVADTGSGIDTETQKRIFDPFFTTKERGKGTGLGLAVVYGIVGAHGGFIDVESELGRGTRFNIFLPASPDHFDAVRREAEPPDGLTHGVETILLVEDEEPILNLMRSCLEGKGYTVIAAADGAAAVELYTLHADDIALVLTDVGLPQLGGISVVKKIREMRSNVPVVLASGFLTEEQRIDAKHLGVGRIIAKPYQPIDVLVCVRESIDAHRRSHDHGQKRKTPGL